LGSENCQTLDIRKRISNRNDHHQRKGFSCAPLTCKARKCDPKVKKQNKKAGKNPTAIGDSDKGYGEEAIKETNNKQAKRPKRSQKAKC